MHSARPHCSYSQLAQYLRCPLQYYFERIARLPKPFTPSGLVLGRAVHEGLATYHRQRLHQQPLRNNLVRQSLLTAWHDAERERPVQYRRGETRAGLIELAVSLLDKYLEQPICEPIVAVERTWLVPLVTSGGEILDKPLMATLDLIVRDEEGLLVTEFKTSARRYSQSEVDIALQATSYAHTLNERDGKLPAVRYVVLVKNKPPVVQQLTAKRSQSDLFRLGDIFQSVERAMQANAFYPIESQQNCSGCPFRQPCREWQSGSACANRVPENREVQLTTC